MEVLQHELEEVQLHGKITVTEKYARFMVLNPIRLCTLYCTLLVTLTAVVMLGGFFEILNTTEDDLVVASSEASKVSDSLEGALEMIDALADINQIPPRSRTARFFSLSIIYEWSDASKQEMILTPKNVQAFCKFQNLLTATNEYKKICLTDDPEGLNTTCGGQPTDIVHYFYSNETESSNCPLLADVEFEAIYSSIFVASPASLFFYDKNYLPPESNTTYVTRSTIQFGGPLGEDSTPDGKIYSYLEEARSNDQYVVYDNVLSEFEDRVFKKFELDDSNIFRSPYLVGRLEIGGGVQARYFSQYFLDVEFFRTIAGDQIYIGVAVFFVGMCMYLHLQSVFLAVCGIMTIVFSFPVAAFIYRFLCGLSYITDITMVSIFLILGVGADNIFVLVDAFKQSSILWVSLRGIKTKDEAGKANVYGTGSPETEVLIARFAYAYRRASSSIFNTSFTTAAAFFATGTSPIVPVAAFGIFSAITILVNFLFILTIVSNIVLIHYFYVGGSQYFDNKYCCPKKEKAENDDNENHLHYENSAAEKLFAKAYVPLLSYRFRSIPLVPLSSILILFVLFIIMGFYAFKLEAPQTQEEQFQDNHMITGFIQDSIDIFLGGASTEFMAVQMFWGIKDLDRSLFKRFEPRINRGTPIFDEHFALHTEVAQQYVLDTCAALREYECKTSTGNIPEACSQPKMVFPNSVECFMEAFHDWHNSTFVNSTSALKLGDIDKNLWTRRLSNFTNQFQLTDRIGFIDGEVRFVVVNYVATMKQYSPSAVKEPFFEIMGEFLDSVREGAPVGMKTVKHTSFDLKWITLELGIIAGMYQGLAISLPIAYLVLLIATGNVVLATFAILSIVAIVAAVLGSVYLQGWSLGIAESVAAVMVIGLSVDYTIHLGHMYQVAAKEGLTGRARRFAFSAERMGPTVLAGSITTAGSSAVMFACQLTVFSKMATLIVLTIVFSLVYALFWFLPLCLLFGPEGSFGQWSSMLIFSREKGMKSNDDVVPIKQSI